MVNDAGDSIFKYRYLVAFFEFLLLFAINLFRIATSMSIVAMVNNTAITSYEAMTNNTIPCPLNYSDETDLIIPENDGEFDWSPAVQGYILGSGTLGYAITQMPGGILSETYGAKVVILSGLFISTASHLISPLAARSSSYMLIALQLLRGLVQGCIAPAQSVLSSNWFPKKRKRIPKFFNFDRLFIWSFNKWIVIRSHVFLIVVWWMAFCVLHL
ncbi:unnamed protein product [Larinioides sclopetarius]